MTNEITMVGSMGYPDEIFEVTRDLVTDGEKHALIISHTVPFSEVGRALELASTPGRRQGRRHLSLTRLVEHV
jgi:hypothetical protein